MTVVKSPFRRPLTHNEKESPFIGIVEFSLYVSVCCVAGRPRGEIEFPRGMWASFLIFGALVRFSWQDQYVLGYLTGSQRKPGDVVYPRPGVSISGAISYAVEEVNRDSAAKGLSRRISFVVAETFGEEDVSIEQTAKLWKNNVSGYIGPQETCIHEGRMAASFNLPMISYVSIPKLFLSF